MISFKYTQFWRTCILENWLREIFGVNEKGNFKKERYLSLEKNPNYATL